MKESLMHYLRCPDCRSELALSVTARAEGEIESGSLLCSPCAATFPIQAFIPRFVPESNYAANFGAQWKRFGTTQIDSFAGNTISRDRFLATTDWSESSVTGKVILDGGCGGGRFAEVALSLGAEVIAIDFSAAIDECRKNLRSSSLHCVQADIAKLPIADRSVFAAYSMGVLQHTPDVRASFAGVARVVAPGGSVIVDVYELGKLRYLNSIYWYRPLLKHVPQDVLFGAVERIVTTLQPLKDNLMTRFRGHPFLSVLTSMVIPINAHRYQFPFLSPEQARAWAILNTFDAYSPTYDQPQTPATMRAWARELNLDGIEVFTKPGHGDGTALVCRGVIKR